MNATVTRINLAHEAEFALGDLLVRPALRQIVLDGDEQSLEPRVMQVLVAMARRTGEVVTRDELLELCWAGRIVGEDAIQRAIGRVRQLGRAGDAFSIQTISRVGYRLIPSESGAASLPPRDPWLADPVNGNARAIQHRNQIPTIGVLPFGNLAEDDIEDHFVDGICEDIITALSRFREFRTAPRGATFAYRGTNRDPTQIGRQLGLGYVLSGSVRLAQGRVRVSVELVHCETGRQVWRDSFDRKLADNITLQDELSRSVAAALFPALRAAEVAQAEHLPVKDLSAYDLYLRALPHLWSGRRDDNLRAIELLRQSLEHEITASVLSSLALALILAPPLGAMEPGNALGEALELARQAVERDASDSFTHATYSTALSVSSADRGQVVLHAQEAVRLNPGAAYAWGALGIANCMIGEFNRGLASLETARQLSPSDMLAYLWLTFEGAANFALEHYDASVVSSRKAMLRNPGYGTAHRLLAASLAQLGQIPEARAVTRRRDLQQTASLAEIRSSGLFHQPGVMDRYVEAQRLCGLT